MGAITCTPIFKAWAQGEGYLVLILRRSRQSGNRPDRQANIYVFFQCFDDCVFPVSRGPVHAPNMLLNTLHIGHDTI